MQVLDSLWVFWKKNSGVYKARLVAKGCQQRDGLDYAEIYSPVAKLNTVRILLSLIVRFNLEYLQLDVKTAFLNSVLNDDVFMMIPMGHPDYSDINADKVFKLNRAIYGLKQAPRAWYDCFDVFII